MFNLIKFEQIIVKMFDVIGIWNFDWSLRLFRDPGASSILIDALYIEENGVYEICIFKMTLKKKVSRIE